MIGTFVILSILSSLKSRSSGRLYLFLKGNKEKEYKENTNSFSMILNVALLFFLWLFWPCIFSYSMLEVWTFGFIGEDGNGFGEQLNSHLNLWRELGQRWNQTFG